MIASRSRRSTLISASLTVVALAMAGQATAQEAAPADPAALPYTVEVAAPDESGLADTARAVLKNGMTLIGCSAPEKM